MGEIDQKTKLKTILLRPIHFSIISRILITSTLFLFSLLMIIMVCSAYKGYDDNSSEISDLKYGEIRDLQDRIKSLEDKINKDSDSVASQEYDCSANFKPIQISITNVVPSTGTIYLLKMTTEYKDYTSPYIIELADENGVIWSDIVDIWMCTDKSAKIIVEDIDYDGYDDIRVIAGTDANLSNTYQTIFLNRDRWFVKVKTYNRYTWSEIFPAPIIFTKNQESYDALAPMTNVTTQSYSTVYYKWEEDSKLGILLRVVKIEEHGILPDTYDILQNKNVE